MISGTDMYQPHHQVTCVHEHVILGSDGNKEQGNSATVSSTSTFAEIWKLDTVHPKCNLQTGQFVQLSITFKQLT